MKSHFNLQKYYNLKEIDYSYKHADRHYTDIFFFVSIKSTYKIRNLIKKYSILIKKFAKFYNFDPRNFYDQLNSPKVQIWSEVG